MKNSKFIVGGLVVASVAAAVLSVTALGVMYRRVKAFDARHQCNVLAGLSPADMARQKKACEPKVVGDKREGKSPNTNATEVAVLKVDRVDYDGDATLSVVFNARPDMDVVRRYVSVTPLVGGAAGFRYKAKYNYRLNKYEPTLLVTGDFAYRTNATLRILKGFPLYSKGTNSTAKGALESDFTYTFRRRDPPPSVNFADDGRYLPPGGRKAVRIESVSVTNVATSICRVEPRNIVQLLAREERVYRRSGWRQADEEDTEELAGACETGVVRCMNRPCEWETNPLAVGVRDGGPERGVFLVAVRNGDLPQSECYWDNTKYNPNVYRLVCLSDLGLSVRSCADGLGVWVASLMTGRPVADARVEVYSSANILVAEGDCDANGWCVPTRCAEGEPFAVVVWTQSDMTFLALRNSMKVDETYADGYRPNYLAAADVDAFVWTERGIYRHDERIFVHGVARNGTGKAPSPMPLVLALQSPKGHVFATKTVMTDEDGAFAYDGFSVPAEQPSGKWNVLVRLPGKDGKVLAVRGIKVEEFAPPQIRVSVTADAAQHPTNFAFRVSAEHLFGGPARTLGCEGAVVFEDVPFAPAGWKGFSFGNDDRGLKPCFRRLSQRVLDDAGVCDYAAPLWADAGLPKAAMRATGQGVVFEDGGRPATARRSIVCHYYPFYVGSDLPAWLKRPATGFPKIALACVDPDGRPVGKGLTLLGKIERIDPVYAYRKKDNGQSTWDCERVRTTVLEQIEIPVGADGRAEYALPLAECGDYVFTAEDRATGASFARAFYLGDWGDETVRAPLSDPTEVTIQTDKSFYRVGERPRLIVKSPFAGYAQLSVLRDGLVYNEILNLTNATSVIDLRPVERAWAPNVDVEISVVQSVAASAKHLAARAHGLATIRVRPVESEIDVKAEVAVANHRVVADIVAEGADGAVVTLVDEGINLLTDEPTPNPVGWLARDRAGAHPLFDLYGRILPVADDGLRRGGVKTGGGFGAEMLGRVSPVPTRRFKPLALWQSKVAVTNGKARAVFDLPEFAGEVRVTVVAYSAIATGAVSVRKKVTPKLVMQPDAPRFVAPGDAFEITLPLSNRSGSDGGVDYAITFGEGEDKCLSGRVFLKKDCSTNVVARVRAPDTPGEMSVSFSATGFGERHAECIDLPVRPAVPWRSRAEVVRLEPGEELRRAHHGAAYRFAVSVGASPMSEFAAAMDWLADYPHGCLEQTSSRIFPLVAAGGVLNAVASKAATNRAEFVAAGVRRVESMVRENDFVMWPDCTYAPWDREVSLYAAHFLVEAEKSGQRLNPQAKARVMKFLRTWALGTNDCESAYACHTLALAGTPEKDRMFRLYDRRTLLDALARARLARAFAAIHDRPRAEALMQYALEPQSVREAAFRALALMDLNPDDARIPGLVSYLNSQRDRERLSWGTTAENAHALLAIGAYFAHHPAKGGEVRVRLADGTVLGKGEARAVDDLALANAGTATAFLTVREQWLDDPASVKNEANGIFISRRYLRANGEPADMANLVRGEMLVAELTITSDVTRVVGDLVVEDLFAGAFEPVHRELDPSAFAPPSSPAHVADWVMRKDARDDRMLVFSKRFELKKGDEANVFYPVRVVSAGDFVLPGPTVEGMYHPDLRARRAPARVVVRR